MNQGKYSRVYVIMYRGNRAYASPFKIVETLCTELGQHIFVKLFWLVLRIKNTKKIKPDLGHGFDFREALKGLACSGHTFDICSGLSINIRLDFSGLEFSG